MLVVAGKRGYARKMNESSRMNSPETKLYKARCVRDVCIYLYILRMINIDKVDYFYLEFY